MPDQELSCLLFPPFVLKSNVLGLGPRPTRTTNTLVRSESGGLIRPRCGADLGFRKRGHEPVNWHFCQHGERNDRMVVERVFSIVTVVGYLLPRLANDAGGGGEQAQ